MLAEPTYFPLHRKRHWEKGSLLHLAVDSHKLYLEPRYEYEINQEWDLSSHYESDEHSGDDDSFSGQALILHTDLRNRHHVLHATDKNLIAKSDAKSLFILSVYSHAENRVLWKRDDWEGRPLLPLALAFGPNQMLFVLHLERSANDPKQYRFFMLHLAAADGRVHKSYPFDTLQIDPQESLEELKRRYLLIFGPNQEPDVFDRKTYETYSSSAGTNAAGEPYEALKKVCAEVDHTGGQIWLQPDEMLFVYDQLRNKLTSRVLRARPRRPQGVWVSHPLDSTEAGTVWHKIRVESVIPYETQMKVYCHASDQLKHFSSDPVLETAEEFWGRPLTNPKDALLFGAKGRYLWLRIEFTGSDRLSPILHKIQVHFPRDSYLRYLPAIYQEHEKSRDFLERFLSLFETFLDGMEKQIDGISRYFDADSAPDEFLSWLGLWLGVVAEDLEGQGRSRELVRTLIKRAPALYQKRGTPEGLKEAIEIVFGSQPYVIEYFHYHQLLDEPAYRDLLPKLFDADPHSFTVLVKPQMAVTESQRVLLNKIIEQQKPVFTQAKLQVLWPQMRLGEHLYLGVNTVLSEPGHEGMEENPLRSYYVL